MKKLLPLVLFGFFAFSVSSCSNDDDEYVDYDTYSTVYDLTNVNFEWVDGSWVYYQPFQNPMYSSDVVLVYLQNGSSAGAPVWQQIPITFYLNDGNEIDYNFDFTVNDLQLYAGGTFDLGGTSYVNNRTFRVVFVPAEFGNKNANLDYSDYESVIEYYNIDDSNPVQLN
ncbi:MAG TPA: hypothetical protein VKY36_03400 [Moheibacter sp.]|nr:hypothetical protein [Moheibacter sp.]